MVLKELADKISESKDLLDGQAIGNALYGLQGLGNSEGVEDVLKALAVKIRESKDLLKAHESGCIWADTCPVPEG